MHADGCFPMFFPWFPKFDYNNCNFVWFGKSSLTLDLPTRWAKFRTWPPFISPCYHPKMANTANPLANWIDRKLSWIDILMYLKISMKLKYQNQSPKFTLPQGSSAERRVWSCLWCKVGPKGPRMALGPRTLVVFEKVPLVPRLNTKLLAFSSFMGIYMENHLF